MFSCTFSGFIITSFGKELSGACRHVNNLSASRGFASHIFLVQSRVGLHELRSFLFAKMDWSASEKKGVRGPL